MNFILPSSDDILKHVKMYMNSKDVDITPTTSFAQMCWLRDLAMDWNDTIYYVWK